MKGWFFLLVASGSKLGAQGLRLAKEPHATDRVGQLHTVQLQPPERGWGSWHGNFRVELMGAAPAGHGQTQVKNVG